MAYKFEAHSQSSPTLESSNLSSVHVHVPGYSGMSSNGEDFCGALRCASDILGVFGWPMVALLFVILCRRSISRFIDRINNLEYGQAKLTLDALVNAKLPTEDDVVVGVDKSEEVNAFVKEMSSSYPIDAIVRSWVELENSVKRILISKDYNEKNSPYKSYNIINRRSLEYLIKSEVIDYSIMNTILSLREIRNLVVHRPDEKISELNVQSYIRTVAEIVSLLR